MDKLLTVTFEDSHTPGFLGSIRRVTDWERREIKIST